MSRPCVRPASCPTGTHHVRHAVRHGGACWVQNQSQIQNQILSSVVGGCWANQVQIVKAVEGRAPSRFGFGATA